MCAENNTEQPPTAAALVIDDGCVLLVKEEQEIEEGPVYGLPGGVVEPRESHTETVVRELEDETGLHSTTQQLEQIPGHFVSSLDESNTIQLPFTLFICHNYTGKLQAKQEIIPTWVPLSQLEQYPLLPVVQEAVEQGVQWLHNNQ